MNPETLRILLIFGLLGLVVLRNVRGFIHFLRPGAVRYRELPGREDLEDPAVRLMGRELSELGFSPLGTVLVQRPLSPAVPQSVHVNDAGDYGVVFPVGRDAWLYFLSEPRAGSFVLTADHRFPSSQKVAFRTGGLPDASPEEVFRAHRRQVERMGERDGRAAPGLEAYMEAAARFFAKGPGKEDLRRRSARGFLFASAALLWGAMTFWQLFMNR